MSHDNNSEYRRHRAWAKAKEAFGSGEVVEALTRLECCGAGCPRLLLVAAIHRFLTLDDGARSVEVANFLLSLRFPAMELLTPEENLEIDADFSVSMKRILAESAAT